MDPKPFMEFNMLDIQESLVIELKRLTKPICRLHFNGKHKYIGILDVNKNEEKVSIDNLNEIYKQADKLRATAGSYVPERLLAYLSLKYPFPLIWYNAFINPLTRKKNKVPHSHRRNHVRYYKPNIPT
jgi:hypothetical protein